MGSLPAKGIYRRLIVPCCIYLSNGELAQAQFLETDEGWDGKKR